MEIIYLLIAISLILVGVIAWSLYWAVGSGQYDDLEREGHRILMDDDDISGEDAEKNSTIQPPVDDASDRPSDAEPPPRH